VVPGPLDDDPIGLDDIERRLREIRDDPEKPTTLRALAQYQLECIAALRAAAPFAGTDEAPPVVVERLGPLRLSAIPNTAVVGIEIERGASAPLVGVVSADEVRLLLPLFDQVRDRVGRGEPIGLDLRTACLDLIGRDPFPGQV